MAEAEIDAVFERNGEKWAVLTAEALPNTDMPGGYEAVRRPTQQDAPAKGLIADGYLDPRPAPPRESHRFVDPVQHAGMSFPRHVRVDWERVRDGLTVSMVVRTDPKDGPRAIWVEIRLESGLLGSDDRAIPLATFAKDSARMLAFGLFDPIRHAPRMTPEETLARLRLVAELHKEATDKGLAHKRGKGMGVRSYVHQGLWERMPELGVSEHRVSQLISEARRTKDPLTGKTFLPATDPGKAAK